MTYPKCSKCALKVALEKWDYGKDGCRHTPQEGFVCLALAHEGTVVQMVGIDPDKGGCEMFKEKK